MTGSGSRFKKKTGIILTCSHPKPKASSCLWHGGWQVPCGHWQSACAYENHVLFCGVYDEAGKYVS